MERWVWFGLDPAERLAGGEYAADDPALLRDILRGRGLEPLLVLPRTHWHEDLAGGPPGVPPPVRTAAEIALLRAEGTLELPPMRAEAAARFRVQRRRPVRHRWHGRRRDVPKPTLVVHARPWSRSLVSVAVWTPSGEVLSGTERLFSIDDEGLTAAAEWKGQLEFVCEQWLLDASAVDGEEMAENVPREESDAPDAHTAARLLDD